MSTLFRHQHLYFFNHIDVRGFPEPNSDFKCYIEHGTHSYSRITQTNMITLILLVSSAKMGFLVWFRAGGKSHSQLFLDKKDNNI